jgi:hypothetical protein
MRPTGVYWVKAYNSRSARWMAAFWTGAAWQMFGDDGRYQDDDFAVIGPRVPHPDDEVISEEDLSTLEALERDAWEGPWMVQDRPIWRGDSPDLPGTYAAVTDQSFVIANFQPTVSNERNARFVAAIRNAAPTLFKTIRSLKARLSSQCDAE